MFLADLNSNGLNIHTYHKHVIFQMYFLRLQYMKALKMILKYTKMAGKYIYKHFETYFSKYVFGLFLNMY